MRKKIFKITYLVLGTFLLASCATSYVSFYGKNINKIQSITLFSTIIGKIQQPVFPIIDAAIFNSMTNSLADQIIKLEEKNIDNYREIIASGLKRNYNCEILYGDSLAAKTGLTEFKQKYNFQGALETGNKHFPKIIIASNEFIPFAFYKGGVIQYFEESMNYKPIISEICKRISTDLLVISYTNLSIPGVQPFGLTGTLRLTTYLYIFNKEGTLVADGRSWSNYTYISGNKIEQYENQLNNFSLIIEPLIVKSAGKIHAKEI